MGYDNRFSLKINGDVTKPSTFCPECKIEVIGNFCNHCGCKLETIQVKVNDKEIIKELRDSSDDCAYLLSEKGGSYETGSGHEIEDDIKKFSTRYPDVIFQLDCTWDSGFGDPPSRFYFKNGVKKNAKAKVTYQDPEF